MRTALEIAEEFVQLAGRRPHLDLAMRGHLAMEVTLINLGEFAPALEHFYKALQLYDREQHLDDSFLYTQPPGSAMRCHAAWALWFLGHPDQALRLMKEALALARELNEPHGLAHVFFFASILHQLRGETAMAQEHAEAAIVVSKEHRLLMYQAMTTMTRGWALAQLGRLEEGIAQMRQGLAAIQTTCTQVQRPLFLAQLAYALGKTRQPEEARHQLEEALAIADRTGERLYEAELYRLKGELLLMQSKGRAAAQAVTRGKAVSTTESSLAAQAEHCFDHSIKVAQRQNAKSLELRAVTSMARLYQNQGQRAKARRLLEDVYATFTEGFDTSDLREAKALLDELS
jgi:predicted ATPase